MGFKGKVKTTSTTIYKAELKFGNIEKGSKVFSWYKEFDENGNKIRVQNFGSDGQLDEMRTYCYNELNKRIDKKVFDKNEKLILHNKYRYNGSEGYKYLKINNEEFRQRNYFKIDNFGNIVETIEYASKGNIIGVYKFKYDRKNKCVEEIRYKYDGKIDYIIKNKYDGNGNEIQTKKLNSDGSLESKSKFKYDSDFNCTKMSFYKSDNSLERIFSYKYDFNGNVVKLKELNSQGILLSNKEKFEYQYDNSSNWIYMISFRKIRNEIWMPFEITERTFEYY